MRKKLSTTPPGEPTNATQKPAPGAGPSAFEHSPIEETAPVTPSPHLLSAAHQRFAQEFITDLNGTKAYQRAYPDANYETARGAASALLQNPTIRNEVQRLLDERATVTGITSDRVLTRLWEQATYDPRELLEVRVGSCRHCWGAYGLHQHTDAEFERAERAHIHKQAQLRKLASKQGTPFEPEEFKGGGGPGYTPNRAPNPECPECHGDGHPRAIIKDTRHASTAALAMFGGVKFDKNGNMTVLLRDPAVSLKLVAEHLGMLSGKAPTPADADPLQLLLDEIRGQHGAGSALPIVHDDPEARQVTDVEPKAAATPKPAPGAGSTPPSKKQWRPIR